MLPLEITLSLAQTLRRLWYLDWRPRGKGGRSASQSIGLNIGLPLGERSGEDMVGRAMAMVLLQRANNVSMRPFEA